MYKHKTKQNGITLISLVISIIVMLILAGVTLSATVGEDGIITRAQISSLMSRYSLYKEELEINGLQDTEIYSTGEAMKSYIPSMEDIDIEKFVIMKRELLYISDNELEIEAAKSLGIGTAETGEDGSANAINEVKAVISSVINLSSNSGDGYKIPEDDFTETTDNNDNSLGLIGTRLYDRNSLNLVNKTWNIVIEYNNSNQEVARYGSGYYWIKAGETYIIDGKSMTFENDFIIDYDNKNYKVLSGRAANWNDSSTIAVSDGLVLNLDPVSLADGEWRQNTEDPNFYNFYVIVPRTGRESNTGIQKTGDVEYDANNRALKFNKDSENNPNGEGGYIVLNNDADFSNGFTTELYVNLDRLAYRNQNQIDKGDDNGYSGIFCRLPSLDAIHSRAFRCMITYNNELSSKFYDVPGWHGEGVNADTNITSGGSITFRKTEQFDIGKDVYMTLVYKRNDLSGEVNENNDDIMVQENLDKLELYVNGELAGYSYYGIAEYNAGMEVWNNNENPFFVGVCPINGDGNLFYTKGNIMSVRLYTQSLNASEVKDNYDTTLKYRSSF